MNTITAADLGHAQFMRTMQTRASEMEGIASDETRNLRDLKENRQGLERAASEFEAVFVKMLLNNMREAGGMEGGIFPKSNEMEMFEGLMDEAIAQTLTRRKTIGIAPIIVDRYENHLNETPGLKARFVRSV